MRRIDPFDYFTEHASAIRGLGGRRPPTDPRYCCHTAYVEVGEGHAMFHLRIADAHATKGEIALRVHGYREGGEVVLVASGKLALDALDGVTVDASLRFNAIEGLGYAFFAFFSEPSDIAAAGLEVELEELGERIAIRANRAAGSAGGARLGDAPLIPSQRLIDDEPVRRGGAPAEPRGEAATALEIVRGAGLLVAGAQGLLIDASDPGLTTPLAQAGVEITAMGFAPGEPVAIAADRWIDAAGAEGAFDFVLCLSLTGGTAPLAERLDVIGAALRCLRVGGAAAFMLPLRAGPAAPGEGAPASLDRNEIQQIALRLIGQSYAVAQLAFAPVEDGAEVTSFVLRVHKPG